MVTTTTLTQPTDTHTPDEITAHHTIAVEPFEDRHCSEVHEAVVERYRGEVVTVCCRDVDLRAGATLDAVARRYAEMFEADYVVEVTA